jgi:hypothetical protein
MRAKETRERFLYMIWCARSLALTAEYALLEIGRGQHLCHCCKSDTFSSPSIGEKVQHFYFEFKQLKICPDLVKQKDTKWLAFLRNVMNSFLFLPNLELAT